MTNKKRGPEKSGNIKLIAMVEPWIIHSVKAESKKQKCSRARIVRLALEFALTHEGEW